MGYRLDNDKLRLATLQLICEGLSFGRAAESLGFTRQTLAEYRRQNKEFNTLVVLAKAVSKSIPFDPSAVRRLLRRTATLPPGWGWSPIDRPEGVVFTPDDVLLDRQEEIDLATDILPAGVIEIPRRSDGTPEPLPAGEASSRTIRETRKTWVPDRAEALGIPEYTESELVHFTWTTYCDPSTPFPLKAMAGKLLFDREDSIRKIKAKRRPRPPLSPDVNKPSSPKRRERGLTQEAVAEIRNELIGPRPVPDNPDSATGT